MCCDHSNQTSSALLLLIMFVFVLVVFVCLFVFFVTFDISSAIFSLLMSSSFSLKRGLRAKQKVWNSC